MPLSSIAHRVELHNRAALADYNANHFFRTSFVNSSAVPFTLSPDPKSIRQLGTTQYKHAFKANHEAQVVRQTVTTKGTLFNPITDSPEDLNRFKARLQEVPELHHGNSGIWVEIDRHSDTGLRRSVPLNDFNLLERITLQANSSLLDSILMDGRRPTFADAGNFTLDSLAITDGNRVVLDTTRHSAQGDMFVFTKKGFDALNASLIPAAVEFIHAYNNRFDSEYSKRTHVRYYGD